MIHVHITAPELAARLGLRRAGRDFRGDCPTCGYRDALILSSSRTGRPLLWCASCQDRDAMRGLLRGHGATPSARSVSNETARRERDAANRERAMAIWHSAVPAVGTPAETYLSTRGLPGLSTSPALRFRGDCQHPEGGRYPAMVAIVSDVTGAPMAIHRTYLRRDGSGKATVEPAKASLGPVWGGAIRLGPLAPELVIAEGIESAASAGRLMGLPTWAAISAGNLAKGLVLPPQARRVVIAADPDSAGRDAARDAWLRWRAEGREVRIATPDRESCDFNDLLREREADHA